LFALSKNNFAASLSKLAYMIYIAVP
jgi:hypothetical protein